MPKHHEMSPANQTTDRPRYQIAQPAPAGVHSSVRGGAPHPRACDVAKHAARARAHGLQIQTQQIGNLDKYVSII